MVGWTLETKWKFRVCPNLDSQTCTLHRVQRRQEQPSLFSCHQSLGYVRYTGLLCRKYIFVVKLFSPATYGPAFTTHRVIHCRKLIPPVPWPRKLRFRELHGLCENTASALNPSPHVPYTPQSHALQSIQMSRNQPRLSSASPVLSSCCQQ